VGTAISGLVMNFLKLIGLICFGDGNDVEDPDIK
jgi:hypothetical protein